MGAVAKICFAKILTAPQPLPRFFVQPDVKSCYAIRTPELCGIAYIRLIGVAVMKKSTFLVISVIGLIVIIIAVIGFSNRRQISKSEYYTPLESRHSYSALPDKYSKEIYDQMKKCVYSSPKENEKGDFCFSDIVVDKGVTPTQVFLARKAFLCDNPDVFWLAGWKTVEYAAKDHVVFASSYNPEQLKTMKEKYEKAVADCLSKVEKGLSAEELEKFIHDYLIDNCQYDMNAVDANGNSVQGYSKEKEVHSSYGAIVDRSAVCGGYAEAYQLLLNRLGVDCVTVYGKGNSLDDEELRIRTGGINHAWNAVKNGSTWLMTDVTWDDSDDPQKQHSFFNLSINEMYQSHQAQLLDTDHFTYSSLGHLYSQDDNLFLPH